MELVNANNIKASVLNYRNVAAFFVIFYFVGFIGTIYPPTHSLFTRLIPYALILSIIAIIYFHGSNISTRLVLSLTVIYLLGYFIEVIGVNTGLIFGDYQYGKGLGVFVFNTPLFIGVNWVMLIYASSSVLSKTSLHVLLKISLGALVMLIYDIMLEQVAPIMDMWYWKDNRVPTQNYIAWFVVAFIFHGIFRWFGINTKNRMALVILVVQTIFFFSLAVYYNLNR